MKAVPAALPQRIPRRRPETAAPGSRERHLQVVDTEARRRERRRRGIVRAWALGLVVASLVGVIVHALMAQGQMHLDRLDTAVATEVREYEEARLAVANAQSPAVVITRAREQGLVAATATRSVPVPVARGTAPKPTTDRDAWATVKPLLEAPR